MCCSIYNSSTVQNKIEPPPFQSTLVLMIKLTPTPLSHKINKVTYCLTDMRYIFSETHSTTYSSFFMLGCTAATYNTGLWTATEVYCFIGILQFFNWNPSHAWSSYYIYIREDQVKTQITMVKIIMTNEGRRLTKDVTGKEQTLIQDYEWVKIYKSFLYYL